MICKSSSLVTGFSLHTNKTFSGGAISAEGKSPTISRIVARACASFSCLFSSNSEISTSSVISSSAPIRSLYINICVYSKINIESNILNLKY